MRQIEPNTFICADNAEVLCELPDGFCDMPVPLFVWCLLNYSKPGDLIIDPFCGSGTTALACHKTGRRFICIDREPKYIEIAQQRYRDLVAQTELFGAGEIESGATSANSAGTQNAQVAMELES